MQSRRSSSNSFSVIEERKEEKQENNSNKKSMEMEMEFWPLQHPMEPDDEDRPVICPMPDPHSSLFDEGRMKGKRTPESWRKRTEVSREVREEGNEGVVSETPVRAVRKRHHHSITPLTIMSPLPPQPTQNITIFQMLDKFES